MKEKRSARYPRPTALLLPPASHKQPRDSAVPFTDRSATNSNGLRGPRGGSKDPAAEPQRPEEGSRVNPAARSPPAPSEGRRAGPATPKSYRSPRTRAGLKRTAPTSHPSLTCEPRPRAPLRSAPQVPSAAPRPPPGHASPGARFTASTRRVRACARGRRRGVEHKAGNDGKGRGL